MRYCTEFEALLDLYVDGELPAEEMLRVQAHLDTCPGCQAYVDDLLAIRAAFPDVEDTVVPAGFAEGVMAAVQQSAAPVKTSNNHSAPWKKILLPLAACCAVVVLAMPFSSMLSAKKEEAPAEAPAETAMEMPAAATVATYAADAVAEEAATESAIVDSPAEAPAAPAADIADGAAQEEPAAAEDTSAMIQYTAEAEPAADEKEMAAKLNYASLTLTAEKAGTLLDDYEVTEETKTELRYQLSAEEFDALIAALADAGLETVITQTSNEGFTVTVLK